MTQRNTHATVRASKNASYIAFPNVEVLMLLIPTQGAELLPD